MALRRLPPLGTEPPVPILPEVAELLEAKALAYNHPSFCEVDPISVPHAYSHPLDREVAALLTATIAWGRRDLILRAARYWFGLMDGVPGQFLLGANEAELARASVFVYRTFNAQDAAWFLKRIRVALLQYGGLQPLFALTDRTHEPHIGPALQGFRAFMLQDAPPGLHAAKHVSDISTGSAAKRLCMFLRWMVRRDRKGVDFGTWTHLHPHQLVLPLDVHTGRVARALGLLPRSANDWRAARWLTNTLKQLDPNDPVRYDFALFGLGVFDGFPGKTLTSLNT